MNQCEVVTASFPEFKDRKAFLNSVIGEIDNGLFDPGRVYSKACDAIVILEELRDRVKERYLTVK